MATRLEWLELELALFSLLRTTRKMGCDSPWPDYMGVSVEEVTAELPFTPVCRHVEPHKMRSVETEEELLSYLVFKHRGWEEAGYCWSYVPAFLHEWFGCGPQQELFVTPSESRERPL